MYRDVVLFGHLELFLKWGGGTIFPFFGAPWVGHVLFRLRINLVMYKVFMFN